MFLAVITYVLRQHYMTYTVSNVSNVHDCSERQNVIRTCLLRVTTYSVDVFYGCANVANAGNKNIV